MKCASGQSWFLWTASILLICLLPGCSFGPLGAAPDSLPYEPFVPPTLAPTALPTNTPAPTEPAASNEIEPQPVSAGTQPPGSECSDGLSFVSDLTIPDGTVVVPGSTLDKQWEVENNGDCNWGEGYQVRLISGEAMGAAPEQALIPARSGSRATIRIVFTAPADSGEYRSAWQAYNAQGIAFGDPIFIVISVE